MNLSAVITAIIVLLGLYYIVMILWDQYKLNLQPKESKSDFEDAIDISTDLNSLNTSTINIDTFPSEKEKEPESQKIKIIPFPWPVDKFCEDLNSIILGEECKDLEDVILLTGNQFKSAL